MSMSARDFEAVAAAIRDADVSHWPFPRNFKPGAESETRKPLSHREQQRTKASLALMLADTYVSQNDRFDPVRFIRACGVDSATLPGSEIRSYSARLLLRMQSVKS